MFGLVIFDWSGTLFNDAEVMWRASCGLMEHYGVEPISFGEYRERISFPITDYYQRLGIDASFEELSEVFSQKMGDYSHVRMTPHASELLHFLRHRGVKTSILTANPANDIYEQLKAYELVDFFDTVHCKANDKTKEIHNVLQEFDVPRENTLFIGDMDHDIEAGKTANIKTCAVTYGFHPKEKLEAARPDYIIDSLEEVERLFKP